MLNLRGKCESKALKFQKIMNRLLKSVNSCSNANYVNKRRKQGIQISKSDETIISIGEASYALDLKYIISEKINKNNL